MSKSGNPPKQLILGLIVLNVALGFAEFANGTSLMGWQRVVWQLLLLLIIIPGGVTVVALPLKIRDSDFQLKLAYYLGLFGSLLYALQAMRYLR